MYPDSWIYRGFTSCNFDLCWKQNGGPDNDLRKIHGFRLLIYAQTALVWNSTTQFCNATSNFDKCHDILCLHAEFAAKHTKAPSPLTTRWKTWPGFWLMAVARYIALPLISQYLSMDPTNRDISGLHCTTVTDSDAAQYGMVTLLVCTIPLSLIQKRHSMVWLYC